MNFKTTILVLFFCGVTLIQVSCKQKKKSEGLLVIPRCMGKRIPSHKYNEAVKYCKGKKTEMCSYMCVANRLKFVENYKINDKKQHEHIEDVYPKEGVEQVMKEVRICRKHYVSHDKDSDCQGNHDWAKCNKSGAIKGCKRAEKKH